MTLFVLAWWKRPEARSAKWWFLVGVLGGLLTLCRWQFGPIVAITLLDWKRARWRLGLVALGYALVLAPQLWVDRVTPFFGVALACLAFGCDPGSPAQAPPFCRRGTCS